ncbi:MAG: hypothetical protein ACRD00_07935 [Thermoanaerobaculia bacterium]
MKVGQRSGWRGSVGPSKAYDVGLDRERIQRKVLGPDRTRFIVALRGGVDDRWRREYRAVQLDSTDLFRYRLDLEADMVCFEGRGGEGELIFLLDCLVDLVAQVNWRASCRAPLRRPA